MNDFEIKDQKRLMLITLIENYYSTDGAGGTCHIVLDDGNIEDGHVQYCKEYSEELNDFWGLTIATLLLDFSEEEREEIIEEPWKIKQRLNWFN